MAGNLMEVIGGKEETVTCIDMSCLDTSISEEWPLLVVRINELDW